MAVPPVGTVYQEIVLPAELALNDTVEPEQAVGAETEVIRVGESTSTITVAVLTQPFACVPVTV
jgi:hypothetical protein